MASLRCLLPGPLLLTSASVHPPLIDDPAIIHPSPRRRTDRWRAKYELLHVVRTHMGQDDAHYG